MQTCFFAISGILPREEAITKIKSAIKKTYGNKGDEIVEVESVKAVEQILSPVSGKEVKKEEVKTNSFNNNKEEKDDDDGWG